MEQQYRLHRGEGFRLLKADWATHRVRLNSFIGTLRKHKEQTDKAQAKTKPSTTTTGSGKAANAVQPAKPPLPPPPVASGSNQDDKTVYGCSKCRYSQSGCLACNPKKAMKWSQTAKTRSAVIQSKAGA